MLTHSLALLGYGGLFLAHGAYNRAICCGLRFDITMYILVLKCYAIYLLKQTIILPKSRI